MPNGMQPRHQIITGEGSGFFISADGYAVTNNHVVDHAKSVQVTTDDGTIYTAKVIGTDPKTDLALIKVDGKSDFPYVKFCRTDAAGRRLGGRRRQSVRSRRHRDGRHRLGARPRHRRGSLRRLHPDRRPDQQGQFRRPGLRRQRQRDRRQHRDLLAVRRLGRHRLRHSGRNREDGRGPAQGQRPRHARLARRADPAGDRRDRRQPRHEEGRRRDGRRAAGRQSRPPRPGSRPATSSPPSTARR